MSTPVWLPDSKTIINTPVTSFIGKVNGAFSTSIKNVHDLYHWSVKNPEHFWSHFWDFADICGEKGSRPFLTDSKSMVKASWFPDAKINFSENLLRHRGEKAALVFYGEDKLQFKVSRDSLRTQVNALQKFLITNGIKEGDVVAALLPNVPFTVIGMLAAASIGALFTSCSPDFGSSGIIDRFGQTKPKILLTTDGYWYRGQQFLLENKLKEVIEAVPSIKLGLWWSYLKAPLHIPTVPFHSFDSLIADEAEGDPEFKPLPFNHPLYILYSSGTTGKPKCIVHGAGGTLLEHQKEHLLHVGLQQDDVIFYQTTCGWMMWNWLVSALAVGSTVVLYDGYPLLKDGKHLWNIVDEQKISVFGTNAKFLSTIEKAGIHPKETNNLHTLHTVLSTGSPLLPESFEYVYEKIKKDLCLSSISGGTDIIGCFALGNRTLPVFKGELQIRSFGLDVQVWDESRTSLQQEKGELVCTAPFPSQPLGFWGDDTKEKYLASYFSRFPGVWCHGDFVELTENEGMIFYGRSDAVLNPGGIRIGTAEIYRQVEKLEEIEESVAVGQDVDGDVIVVLLVKLKEGSLLDENLKKKIRHAIRNNASPYHVPKKILEVPDIPKTRNGKVAELAVRDVINGKEIKNIEALANPEALDAIRGLT